ncbi:trifunctional dihydropteroate synthetase [Vanrija albida]|uniref:Trifunctional dihydropteroate synthetase n=1 Tax=Vanrija albida TaxID=181172 RepID=A0ABR3QDK1_9TREE
MPADRISVTALSCHLAQGLGPSAFGLSPPPPCPVELDIDISLAPEVVPHCVDEDDMQGLGVNYSSVSKAVYAALMTRAFSRPSELLDAVAAVPLALKAVSSVRVTARLPRALLPAQSAEYARSFTPAAAGPISCTLRDLRASCIVGLHPHERAERQRLEADITVTGPGVGAESWSHKAVADAAFEWLEKSSFGTLESLADTFARELLALPAVPAQSSVDVEIRKPSALPFATPSISVSRRAEDFAKRGGVRGVPLPPAAVPSAPASAQRPYYTSARRSPSRVFIAVGSNIGDRVGHVRRAVKLLEAAGCALVDTSRLYESEPMYVEDQALFLNGVIEVATALAPLDLLRVLKRTETEIGRTKTFRNGPRVIDLDLVLYGDEVVRVGKPGDAADEDGVGWLECPHASLAEREFVLRPLADIAPELIHPAFGVSVAELLSRVTPGGLAPVIPFPAPAKPLRLTSPATPAVMAIFNATPDSFSDGNERHTETGGALERLTQVASSSRVPAIIDIGGMSTRPNSEPCSTEEELERVVPLVTAARASDGALASIPISVDTYRPEVALAAVKAGASCINDVRGGAEEGMPAAMAAANVPVVLMHSRGDSTTMLSPEAQDYSAHGGVVGGVAAELGVSVQRALDAGVKRWDIVLDPGLGFAKSQDDHLRLLRSLPELAATPALANFPLLVGGSRKGFVGRVTGRTVPAERGAGDAAISAWCTATGVVDVLRVHDAESAADTVAMSAAIRDVPPTPPPKA